MAVSACGIKSDRSPQGISQEALAVDRVVKPESLEKPNITVGYVPVNDCAPFAVAWEKGFFYKYGLNVTLSREASWANSRDGVIFGRLDASPVVSGAVTNARNGAEGARHAPLCAAMTIHRHGNALTMNRKLWEGGIRPWQEYRGDLEAFGRDFHAYFSRTPPEARVWAVVLSSSIYEYFVRYLVAAAGLNPIEEFRIIITPPPQMVSNMRIGAMQAYMVAEPWNTRAISGNEDIGFTFAQGREIWRGHPDRVLAVMESFIEENPKSPSSLDVDQQMTANNKFLVIENLFKAFSKPDGSQSVVLDGIDLTVGAEEYISIIGHSGCGKSTLLRAIAGLERPTSGLITLEGQEIRQPGADRMMVFQNYALLPWLTVRENIRLAVDEVLKNANRAEKISLVNEHLEMVNLTAAADKYPDEISGGMKQRVGIARALVTRPKMLLMDEPFGALDALTKRKLQKQVLEIWESHRQAVMMITHDVDEAIYMSDRIILMTNGPAAKIGEILEVPFPHPRDRHAMQESPDYYELRNHALDFLERFQ